MNLKYDVIVIGAGHAGSEAAVAAARLGAKVLIITTDMTKIAYMSCNPAVGGIAKGQIVREIDALGGCMGIITDKSTIQFRMLNRSKGPAMWSPRAQCDKFIFSQEWRALIESTKNVDIWQDTVNKLLFTKNEIGGVVTSTGATFLSQAVIITSGTFLNGVIHIGKNAIQGGRAGENAVHGISEQLKEYGIMIARMKTGTPPRIDIRSINLSSLEQQSGDNIPSRFSYMPILSKVQDNNEQRTCYTVYTSQEVHDILRSGFCDSPMFSGRITGIGPRYCPSIEDKLSIFADKTQHQLFLEPESWNGAEYYLQGFSSSLPIDIQYKALRAIKGFEDVRIFRPAYAVEYDYFPPTQITHSLEVKNIKGLFFAGQVNGTTGYEEAAAQGLMAGINAFLKIAQKPAFILKRDQAYIGVLIDDLVTKGVDEPYRMFTSRAEYRILLRQDNADSRLTSLSYSLGLASKERMKRQEIKNAKIAETIHFLHQTSVLPDQINPYLSKISSSIINQKRKYSDLITRPEVSLNALLELVPRETDNNANCLLHKLTDVDTSLKNEILECVEIEVKYHGYIKKEYEIAQKLIRLDHVPIPPNFSFDNIHSLSIEARQKLNKIKPVSIGQASRIPGVSPADISVLLIYFGR